MSQSPDVVIIEVPARIADLAFQIAIPRDWNSLDLPPEEPDFSEPGAFFPLMLAAAPWAAVVLTVAVRPGFEDGTLQDWNLFLLDSQGIRPTAFAPAAIGNLQGLVGVGRQEQDGTALEVRFAFFEDGGRLVHLGLLAPEAISAPLEPVWKTALKSFMLARPQGQNVAVGPGLGFMPEPVADEASDTPEPAPSPEAAVPEPVASPGPESPAVASPPPTQFTDADLGHYAKSDDLSTLDPEHPVNARLRDQAVGFTPNLLKSDQNARTATLGVGAIQAIIQVAFGWHVIDDGRRTIVLDPDGKIQINLSVIPKEGRSIDQILDDIQAEAVQSYPHPEFLRLEDEGIWLLAVRGIEVDSEPVEQFHLLTAWAMDSAMVRARVTADPPSMRFAVNYAALILKSANYGDNQAVQDDDGGAPDETPAAPVDRERDSSEAKPARARLAEQLEQDDRGARDETPTTAADEEEDFTNQPEWARRAARLEREDRLEEAERLIHDSIPSLHFAIATAWMYRRRWSRLLSSDPKKAIEARNRAADFARDYASYATSGGEGAALSYERDQFLRELGPEPFE